MDQQRLAGVHHRRPSSSTESMSPDFPRKDPDTRSKSNNRWQWANASLKGYIALQSLFKGAVPKKNQISRSPSYPSVDIPTEHKIDEASLAELVKNRDLERLNQWGGVEAVSSALGTDIKTGIEGDNEDITHRYKQFGSNLYQEPLAKGFFHFVVEAFKDLTMTILLGCAAFSLVFGIKLKNMG